MVGNETLIIKERTTLKLTQWSDTAVAVESRVFPPSSVRGWKGTVSRVRHHTILGSPQIALLSGPVAPLELINTEAIHRSKVRDKIGRKRTVPISKKRIYLIFFS